MRELIEPLRAALCAQVELVLVQGISRAGGRRGARLTGGGGRRARGVRAVTSGQHAADGRPVLEDPLQRSPTESRRLQVVLRHLGLCEGRDKDLCGFPWCEGTWVPFH